MASIVKGQTTDNRYPGTNKNNPACIDASKVNRKSSLPKSQSVGKFTPKELTRQHSKGK